MECVYRTSDRTLAQLLRGALDSQGVASVVQGEHLTPLQGELPAGASAQYRVCIVDPDQLPRASLLTRQWLDEKALRSAAAWVCRACGERHEPQFASCWKCGADADAA
jgi:hypothetical protein